MEKNPKKQPNKFLILSSLGLEMGLTMFLSVKLGNWLDTKYGSSEFNYFTMAATVLGFIAMMYLLIKKLKKIQD